jgi:hypothetical protein
LAELARAPSRPDSGERARSGARQRDARNRDELPTTLAGRLISEVASQGEHRDLAWHFVQANFAELATKQGQSFQNNFSASLMTNFTDAPHVEELANFAPAHSTVGGGESL